MNFKKYNEVFQRLQKEQKNLSKLQAERRLAWNNAKMLYKNNPSLTRELTKEISNLDGLILKQFNKVMEIQRKNIAEFNKNLAKIKKEM